MGKHASAYHSPAYKAAIKKIGSQAAGRIISDYLAAHADDPIKVNWKVDSINMERAAAAAVIKAARSYRPNPAPSAASMFQSFTGLPSEHEIVVSDRIHEHRHLAAPAQLIAFKLRGIPGRLKFGPGVMLCINEMGTQLYIRGGDQSVSLTEFNKLTRRPVDPSKESVPLGEIDRVYYRCSKPFLGGEHTKTGLYDHPLGEESGNRPILLYDVRNRLLSISGGSYYIDPTDYDGQHSRGIVD